MVSGADLDELLTQIGQKFITLTQLAGRLPAVKVKQLGLPPKPAQKDIVKMLGDPPPGYNTLKKGQTIYLVQGEPEDLVLEKIEKKPGRTYGQLSSVLPLNKNMVRDVVNSLLESGKISAQLSPTDKIRLFPGVPVKAETAPAPIKSKSSVPEKEAERVEAFKAAHDQAARGDYYVYIYRIRRLLNWPRKTFDELMDHLMVEGFVLANPGNPAALTDDEIKDCYQDEFGDLYLTVNWKGRP